tara:strand:+ start:1281 stop:2609 length:1329 start_codon:yes stop_codon:yes gene_type:complete
MVKHRDADEQEEVIESITAPLLETYFTIVIGGKFRIGYWSDEPAKGGTRKTLTLMQKHDFLDAIANIKLPNGQPAGPHFITHKSRTDYKGTVMIPKGHVPDGYLNLWQGYGVEAIEGDCSIILNHFHEVLCAGNRKFSEYMLNWIAAKIQEPTRVMGVMPVFISAQGAGKGVIFEDLLMRIFGQHGLAISDGEQLVGKFNKQLLDACYIFADECFFVGDKRSAQKLKRTITAPVLNLEPKGVDSVTVTSYLGIIAATNMDHAANVEHGNRRILPARCSDKRRKDYAYFDALFSYIEADGASHFLHMMLSRDVCNFHPERDRPMTDETIRQRELSLSGVHRWWQEFVAEGRLSDVQGAVPLADLANWADRPIRISRKSLRDAYQEWTKNNAGEAYSDNKMLAFWNRLGEIAVLNNVGGDNNNRHILLAELPRQIIKLKAFLCQ